MHPFIHVFGLEIPMFGLMMLVGMIAAILLILKIRHYQPYSDDDLSSMAIVTILTGFLGAKIVYWIVELDTIIENPHFLLESLRSGFVFYGALIGGCIGLWLFSKKKKHCALAYADIVMPAFILGQGFGRIGCFFAGCCYGRHTDAWFGVNYPAGTAAAADNPCIPTQLFESAFCILFCIVLVMILRKQKRYGKTFGIYLIGYGIWRFFIEFYRDDDRGAVGALSTSQFIAIFAVLIGIVTLILVAKKKTPDCEELKAAVAEEYEKKAAPDANDGEKEKDISGDEQEAEENTDPVEDNAEEDIPAPEDVSSDENIQEAAQENADEQSDTDDRIGEERPVDETK